MMKRRRECDTSQGSSTGVLVCGSAPRPGLRGHFRAQATCARQRGRAPGAVAGSALQRRCDGARHRQAAAGIGAGSKVGRRSSPERTHDKYMKTIAGSYTAHAGWGRTAAGGRRAQPALRPGLQCRRAAAAQRGARRRRRAWRRAPFRRARACACLGSLGTRGGSVAADSVASVSSRGLQPPRATRTATIIS